MRTPTLVIAALLAATCFAQCPTLDTAAVVSADSVAAADLYARAKKWFADTFKDANEVIQFNDAASNTISGKGLAAFLSEGYIHFTVEIACKDGRYRYEIKDVFHDDPHVTVSKYGRIDAMDMGVLYDCDVCSDIYAWHRKEHPKQTAAIAKNTKDCKERILPIAKGEIGRLVASIKTGMATPAAVKKDW